MKVRAVIFDWAGTTVDFGSCAPVKAVQTAFEQFGVPVTVAEARKPMGLEKRDHLAAILTMPRVRDAWVAKYGAQPGGADVDRLYASFTPAQIEAIPDHADLIPGVLDAVEQLRSRGIRIGTTTGYTQPMLSPLLLAAARQGYVPDVSVTPDEVGAGRPAPFMILLNLVRLQVWPLESVVKVGDTPADIEEARHASVWAVGVAATGNEMGASRNEFQSLSKVEQTERLQAARNRLLSAGAHYVIDTLDELNSVIERIEAAADFRSPANANHCEYSRSFAE